MKSIGLLGSLKWVNGLEHLWCADGSWRNGNIFWWLVGLVWTELHKEGVIDL